MALPYEAETRDAERFHEWVAAGRAGTMGYLERKAENGQLLRERTCRSLPLGAVGDRVLCELRFLSTALNQRVRARERLDCAVCMEQPSLTQERANGERRPSDYHKVLLKRIRAVEARLHAQFGEFESRAYVDTGPVVERALAAAAGLGWTGKNTCLIHPKLGSFGFLAVILTSLEVSDAASPRGELQIA